MKLQRILVANRGEVVSRIARSAHRRGIEVVGIYAESDSRALFLEDVDSAVWIGEDTNSSPYLDGKAIVAAALSVGADSIHPGYGFLAENATFARQVIEAGLTWIGPPAEAIDAMGGKIGALEIAREAGVPVLDSVTLDTDFAAALAMIRNNLTPPLLAKPSAGGGGKGMHRIDDLAELELILQRAQREALASFADPTIFVERYLESARHVEVQIIADSHGTVLHLGTRDCSTQRRHQKIVEEAPAPAVGADLLDSMAQSSIELARRIGYVGAGTVEFLVFGEEYAFLEMNTRLQVEHPVTEQVTGLDLVDLQLDIAVGKPLAFGQDDVVVTGHSIEARLYAEDPSSDYLPSPGKVTFCEFPVAHGVRWEMGIRTNSDVSVRYDPMIAKAVASGADRDEARERLIDALQKLRVTGIRTNRDLLIEILRNDDFVAARLATNFLEEHPRLSDARSDAGSDVTHAIAYCLYRAYANRADSAVQRFAPPAWRNVPSQHQRREVVVGEDMLAISYQPRGDDTWEVTADGSPHPVRVLTTGDGSIDLEISHRRHRVRVVDLGSEYLVDSGAGETILHERQVLDEIHTQAAGALIAPLPGVVVQVAVSDGTLVDAGATLVIVEAMKMEHRITAAKAGRVRRIHVAVGDPVEHQQLIAEMDDEDDAS